MYVIIALYSRIYFFEKCK